MLSLISAVAQLEGLWVERLRDWAPLMYLLGGYWLPAQLVSGTDPDVERALLSFDRRLSPDGFTRFGQDAPRWIVEGLELAYLLCYPMVPAGFAAFSAAGCAGTDGFWRAVLAAALPCYGLLPWLPTRPPRSLGSPAACMRSAIQRLNVKVLDRASVQLNTFPSAHAAASVATALAVGACLPAAGLAFGVIAAGIGVGSVVGRYHYAADAIAGALVGTVAFAASRI
jgi:hypothetical protein